MNAKRIITIAGKPGSGKSSTAKGVASTLEYGHFSSGNFMRTIAHNRNMTLPELSLLAETDSSIDHAIDEENKKVGEQDRVVIDSRLAFHWIPTSFKVYLDLDPKIAAERISRNQTEERKASGEPIENPEVALKALQERFQSEERRYHALYQVSTGDKANYDLVVDTGINQLEDVVAQIVTRYREWCEAHGLEV